MLFKLLKIPASIAVPFYCKKIDINHQDALKLKGPLLIAANHPNSFLDAILLASLFKKPIYSLARGDAFASPFFTGLLHSLNILPVYRLSEGAENLNTNYDTFSKCKEIFRNNGIVLIFSEGLCVNEWKLRPLKKGTARLAISSWAEGIDLKILPTGINYHSFDDFGKSVRLNFGNIIDKNLLNDYELNGKNINHFNVQLNNELTNLVDHFQPDETESIRDRYASPLVPWKRQLLGIPAFTGKWIHAPLYLPIRHFSRKKAAPEGHYDAVVVGLLFILYPLYLLLISLLIFLCAGSWYWLIPFILMPLFAWTFIQYKRG